MRRQTISTKVAKVMVAQVKQKKEYANTEISELTEQSLSVQSKIEEEKNRVFSIETRTTQIEQWQQTIADKNKKELVTEYTNLLKQIKKHPQISSYRLDKEKCLIVRTKLLHVKMPYWKRRRRIGRFEIRIDFKEKSHNQAIRILNIDKRYQDSYDSPTISGTNCCWGNISNDIDLSYKTLNLEELFSDILDYLQSTSTASGFLQYKREPVEGYSAKEMGWDQFFSETKKMEPGFCFEKLLKQRRKKQFNIPDVRAQLGALSDSIMSVDSTEGTSTNITYSMRAMTEDDLISYSENALNQRNERDSDRARQWRYSGEIESRVVTLNLNRRVDLISARLWGIGLQQFAAYYFAEVLDQEMKKKIRQMVSRGHVNYIGVPMFEIGAHSPDEFYLQFYTEELVETGDITMSPMVVRGRGFRYIAPLSNLKRELRRRLSERGHAQRVPTPELSRLWDDFLDATRGVHGMRDELLAASLTSNNSTQ